MAIFYVFINSFRKFFLTKKTNVKNWQCCLFRKPWEANKFHALYLHWPPLEAELFICKRSALT